MLANFLIGLREGLEASLVVSILIAYVVKTGRREQLKWIWLGVFVAVAIAVVYTTALGIESRKLSGRSQELLGGWLSVIAVVFVTFMVFWMAGAAKSIAGELRGRVDEAAGSPLALVLVAFLAVGREGMETGTFLYAFSRSGTGQDFAEGYDTSWSPFASAIVGILVSVALAYLLYRGAVSINLTRFFTWTGVLLIVVAAGVLSYGVEELQAVDVLPGAGRNLYDISGSFDDSAWYGALLGGIFNFTSSKTYLASAAYVVYLVPVMTLFIRKIRSRSSTPAPAASTPVSG